MAQQDGTNDLGGTQSIDRAAALLIAVGRSGREGCRLVDLVEVSGLAKPTVRRILVALVRAGLLDQDMESKRYFLGPESYVLGTLASGRFGIHAIASDNLSRLAQTSGDTTFLSVRRNSYSVCLHRQEGSFPIRTHVLQAGDRHPLGVGAGSLAILSALPDAEVDAVLAETAPIIAERYPRYSPLVIRGLVQRTRDDGYALNPGMLMPGSWGIGVAVRGPDGEIAGALSIAAIETRLSDLRRRELVPLLLNEASALEAALAQPISSASRVQPVSQRRAALARIAPSTTSWNGSRRN